MSDYIVRATAADASIRAFAVNAKEMVETARVDHNTSPVITAALGRLLAAGAMMGSMMKGEKDLLTLRIQCSGPARGLTVTADANGNVKGFPVNPDVDLPPKAKGKLDVGAALDLGILSVIKDLGLKEPYVGQCQLQTGEIAEDLTYYFATSEQTPSAVGLGVLVDKDGSVKQAGGFILQLMPFTSDEVIEKLEKITGKRSKLYKYDLLEKEKLEEIFKENEIDAVIHFAGYKAVGESVKKPLMYYSNNLQSTINLLEVMQKHNVKKLVFSSSATVYGDPGNPKYVEEMGRGETTNPYGTTKAMIEKMLEDLYASDNSWDISILRYFNPVGAHESGLIGEEPNGIPNNLMPYVMKVAAGKLEVLSIFGNDYPTIDGTGVRDFIHVVDLAKGHVSALDKMKKGLNIYNLGSGKGVSVLELVSTFEKVNNIKVNYKIVDRRPGDLAEYYADPTKALNELGWKTEKTLEDICKDSWNYESKNI